MGKRWALAALIVSWVVAGSAHAGDSPQFRGPNRDGCFEESGLLKAWGEGEPKLLWVATGSGKGYSSATVVKGRIYLTGMDDAQGGILSVLDADGKLERRIPYGPETAEAQATGARSTATFDEGKLYVLSGLGVLYCIDPTAGVVLWQVNILERFGGENPTWHAAESVLVDGLRVICTPGGTNGVVAALDKATGETLWATTGIQDKASYCSPTIITHNGRRILTTVTGSYVLGINPETGEFLWSFEQRAPYDIHGVTPLYKDGLLYYVGGDGAGGGALRISDDGNSVTSEWTDKTLDCLHHGVVLVDGYLYGVGYKGGGRLVCLDMATGKVMWETREVRLGVVVYADGMLYVYEGPKSGIVSLVKATPVGFERTGMFTVTEGGDDKHWAHPTIANGRLYLRHGDALMAYDVRAAKDVP